MKHAEDADADTTAYLLPCSGTWLASTGMTDEGLLVNFF